MPVVVCNASGFITCTVTADGTMVAAEPKVMGIA
jgi:hypothetical protein